MDPTRDLTYLNDLAKSLNIVFDPDGECGYGRQCVGFRRGYFWLDYETISPIAAVRPTTAYHKWNCIAVLGRGRAPIHMLAEWMRRCEFFGELSIETRTKTCCEEDVLSRLPYMIQGPERVFLHITVSDLQ